MKKYYSLKQAKLLIPKVKQKIVRLRKLRDALALIEEVDIQYENHHENLDFELRANRKFHKMSYEFFRLLEELYKIGAYVKDIDMGLVDFYSKKGKSEILLCWKLGEDTISYWHDEEEGYMGRKKV